MTNAKRDSNRVATFIGIDEDDTTTLAAGQINPVTGNLKVAKNYENLTVVVGTTNERDQNRVRTAYGVSSSDGTTLIPIHVSPRGGILVST